MYSLQHVGQYISGYTSGFVALQTPFTDVKLVRAIEWGNYPGDPHPLKPVKLA